MKLQLESTQTVGEVAASFPAATKLFEKIGIDYCCGGKQTLADACRTAGIAYDHVAQSLGELIVSGANAEEDWREEKLATLIEHIVAKHHAFIRTESPRIELLLEKVVRVHGGHHPELTDVQAIFEDVTAELTQHLMKEELILFPAIVRMEQQGTVTLAASSFGTIQNPIRMMILEHDSAGDAFAKLHEITADFTAPGDRCTSYRTVYRALADFEVDLHQHIHLENNILFPRAVKLERAG